MNIWHIFSVRKVNEDWKAMVDCDINATKRLAQRKQTRLAQSLQKVLFTGIIPSVYEVTLVNLQVAVGTVCAVCVTVCMVSFK